MLSTAISQSGKNRKINEHILRRQARNLRAKLKALLPTSMCRKYSHRNKNTEQIKFKKDLWETNQNSKTWKYCPKIYHQNEGQLYFEKPQEINRSQRFQKLTNQQIEQIKQDRLYYLGEDNLLDFEKYLRQKKTIQRNKTISNKKQNNTQESQIFPKTPQVSNSRNIRNLQNKQNDKFQSLNAYQTQFTTNKNRKYNSDTIKMSEQRALDYLERKKIIDFQQKSKITTYKVKMNMRMEKAQQSLQNLRIKKLNVVRMKKRQLAAKEKLIKTRRQNLAEKPQIKKIEQQLRRTCLSRFRTKNNEEDLNQFTL